MKQRHLQATDYTVGWICALPIELAAAQEMLDEEDHDILQETFDPNLYTLGRIGEHNVVLACLPSGYNGTQSAATIAARMKLKFTSIRFGLMVGIGGGVPSAGLDIRLGDVVISQPYLQHGGVVQYDFGKTEAAGHKTRTGWLNSPPTVLLNALSKLRALHYRSRGRFATHLAVFEQLEIFSRNAAGPDKLFEPTYTHYGGATCENCDMKRVVERGARNSKEAAIHYGIIASGNQVIRDGVVRDSLSMELGGVMCFEMESAGLMNDFPCLVIRGISDYADSHKNKKWQPYSAATAAACGKEVLSMIPVILDEAPPLSTAANLDSVASYNAISKVKVSESSEVKVGNEYVHPAVFSNAGEGNAKNLIRDLESSGQSRIHVGNTYGGIMFSGQKGL